MNISNNIIGLKELRLNLPDYIADVERGESFIIVKNSKPVFKIVPVYEEDDEQWETVTDFTKIKKGGVNVKDILSRL